MIHPDIGFAGPRLSRFMTNPGPEHHKAADGVLLDLKRTRTYALQFGGDNKRHTHHSPTIVWIENHLRCSGKDPQPITRKAALRFRS